MQTLTQEEYKNLFINATGKRGLSVSTNVRFCVPRGGFGQHVRWLSLLSEEYTDLQTINSHSFFIPKKYYPAKTIDRVDFILDNIYPIDRSFHNWTESEKFFNVSLHNYMGFCHDVDLLLSENREHYTVLGLTDIDTAIKHWYKLHPFWLGYPSKITTKDDFIESTQTYNQKNKNYKPKQNEKVFYFESSKLNLPVLDKNLYDELTKFLKITNVYDLAKIVHERWYNLHVRAEKDVVTYFNTFNYPSFPWTDYKDKFAQIGTKEMYDNIRNTIMEIYA